MYVTKLNRLTNTEIDDLIRRAEEITLTGSCCPRKCGINREKNPPPCGAVPDKMKIASIAKHMGEEPPVSGIKGACNVFFSGCTMKCVFCQNFPFSQLHNGKDYSIDEFCEKLLKYQSRGVHNINLVTSDQYLLLVLKSLKQLKTELHIPIAYNCSGYHTPELLSIADAFTDIYLYDMKYYASDAAEKYSGVKNYSSISRQGAEYILSKNDCWIEENGILKSGVIFRHLVLPGNSDDSINLIKYAGELKKKYAHFRVSVMSQYFPAYKVNDGNDYAELKNKLSVYEYDEVMREAELQCPDGWFQELNADGGC